MDKAKRVVSCYKDNNFIIVNDGAEVSMSF